MVSVFYHCDAEPDKLHTKTWQTLACACGGWCQIWWLMVVVFILVDKGWWHFKQDSSTTNSLHTSHVKMWPHTLPVTLALPDYVVRELDCCSLHCTLTQDSVRTQADYFHKTVLVDNNLVCFSVSCQLWETGLSMSSTSTSWPMVSTVTGMFGPLTNGEYRNRHVWSVDQWWVP